MSQDRITIGIDDQGEPVTLRLASLVASRLLIQADSGGGKSRMLRLIAERLMGAGRHVVVIDPEGEFSTLRERHDLLIVGGADGDVPATVSMARPLPRLLAETRASAVLDLEPLNPVERHQFVRDLAIGLVSLPRKLWGEMYILLDEAPMFAPERGQGDACSTDAVIELAARGRKRGYCLVPATQRFSMLHKNVAAMCSNLLIGPTTPSDTKRAADLAGIPPRQHTKFGRLNGRKRQFIGCGPAFQRPDNDAVELIYGMAETTHPEPGQSIEVGRAGKAMRDILPKLSQLAAEDREREAADLEEAQAQIADLRKQLERAKSQMTADPEVFREAVENAVTERDRRWAEHWTSHTDRAADAAATAIRETFEALPFLVDVKYPAAHDPKSDVEPAPTASVERPSASSRSLVKAGSKLQGAPNKNAATILRSMGWLASIGHDDMPKALPCKLAGISTRSGSTSDAWSWLTEHGYVEQTGNGRARLTKSGLTASSPPEQAPTLAELHRQIKSRLDNRQVDLLDQVIAVYPKPIKKAYACVAVGHSVRSGSTSDNWSRLVALGVVRNAGSGQVVGTSLLFPEGLR